jgi:hypothetical protein
MRERIGDSAAFEGLRRLKILATLNTVLIVVVICLTVEVCARIVGSFRLFYAISGHKTFNRSDGVPWYMYRFVEVSSIASGQWFALTKSSLNSMGL